MVDRDVLRSPRGLASQLLDLIRDHGEAAARLSGAGRLDRCIERQQIGLLGNVANEFDHVADAVGACGQMATQFRRRARDLASLPDDTAGLRGLLLDLMD